MEAYFSIGFDLLAADEDAGFESDEVRYFSDEAYLGLNGCYGCLHVPGELERAIDGFTDGDGFVRGRAEPFIEGYIHRLDSSFDLKEITFGAWRSRCYADRHADVIEEDTEEEDDTVIEFAHLVEDIPQDHREQSDDDADDDESFVIYDACMIGGTDDDDKAGDHPWHGIEDLHDDADMEDGDEELCDEEDHITDDGCDECSQEYVAPFSDTSRSDSEYSQTEGEAEAHDESEERHLCFSYLHEERQDAVHVILDIERESEPSDHRGGDGSEHPFHVERGVMRIEEAVFIEIMRSVLAAVAVFRAVVTVLFPTLFVHGMFAFDDNLIAGLEGRFA